MLDFIGDDPLVAHNAGFDFTFLNWELDAAGHPHIVRSRMIDTLAMARIRHPGAKHSLDALCTRYGIDRSARVKHGALIDAQLLAQLYIELTGGRQIGFSLAAVPRAAAPDSADAREVHASARPVRAPRPHGPTLAELARHAAFVAMLVQPLWPVPPAVDAA